MSAHAESLLLSTQQFASERCIIAERPDLPIEFVRWEPGKAFGQT